LKEKGSSSPSPLVSAKCLTVPAVRGLLLFCQPLNPPSFEWPRRIGLVLCPIFRFAAHVPPPNVKFGTLPHFFLSLSFAIHSITSFPHFSVDCVLRTLNPYAPRDLSPFLCVVRGDLTVAKPLLHSDGMMASSRTPSFIGLLMTWNPC